MSGAYLTWRSPDRANVAQNTKKKSATATWLREWNLDGPRANPLHTGRIPMTLEYLYRHALTWPI